MRDSLRQSLPRRAAGVVRARLTPVVAEHRHLEATQRVVGAAPSWTVFGCLARNSRRLTVKVVEFQHVVVVVAPLASEF